MADRYSEPSASLGLTSRFHVWPLGSDSYKHVENQENWDTLDDILGVPSSGDWPPSRGIDSGIYKEVALLQAERMPLGAIIEWFQPGGLDLPTGWVECDGSTYGPSDNDFPGSITITVPDTRNAFTLGADSNKDVGTSAVAVGNADIDDHSGAPGPQATGGSNQHTLVASETPSHDHGGGDHTHTLNRQVLQLTAGGLNYLINVRDSITNLETTNDAGDIIDSFGSDGPHENRPNWVGLIRIVKIKYIDSL